MSGNFLSGPTPEDVAGIRKGSTVQVLFALYRLEQEAGVTRGERFPASLAQVRVATNSGHDKPGLSYPTIGPARLELVRRGLILSYGEGIYALPLKKIAIPIPVGDSTKPFKGGARGSKKKEKRAGACKNLAGGLTHTERIVVVKGAFSTLRIKYDGGKYSQLCRAKLTRLLKDGHTADEALAVTRWAREKFDAGDRFPLLLDPMYLWSVTKFPPLLAAAQTPPSPRGATDLSNIADPDTRREWREDYQRRLKEKGLA